MAKVLLDSDASESEDGGVQLTENTDFRVNEDFARKFIHNKKREELRRLEDKLGNHSLKRKRDGDDDGDSLSLRDTSSSEDEDEDDVGELATEVLDSEINATLNAIRSKDPRVYDSKTTFYSALDDGNQDLSIQDKKVKPMYLRDYHRENLLNSKGLEDEDEKEGEAPLTYNQEQEALKRSVVGEINAAAANGEGNNTINKEEDDSEDGFLVTKEPRKRTNGVQAEILNIEQADKDPETFLSNFMAARAWIPSGESRFQPLESDDEDEDRRAEDFEQAYNFRFEDPTKANEKLTSHARDVTSQYSVRREEAKSRQKRREAEREKKEAAKQQVAEEKARLRKLRLEEMEEKLKMIKQAAGLRGKDLQKEDWSKFLDDSWDDVKWENEMKQRFGEAYYADQDDVSNEEPSESQQVARKLKKPKWEDDIDIKDLVPDFVEEEAAFSLSEDEVGESEDDHPQANGASKSKKASKNYKKERQERKREARKDRQMIEQLVDKKLEIDTALLGGPSKKAGFRYRETSPVSYGLSARDILLAEDSQLNEFAGLKKLATFRDPEKKKKDQKHLGKRARLRKWRKDTFGDEEGLDNANLVHAPQKDRMAYEDKATGANSVDIRGEEGKKKRRRKSKKSKLEDVKID